MEKRERGLSVRYLVPRVPPIGIHSPLGSRLLTITSPITRFNTTACVGSLKGTTIGT